MGGRSTPPPRAEWRPHATAQNPTTAATTTTTQSCEKWSPHPKQGAEQYAQWNTRTRDVCVVDAMRTHSANRMLSGVTVPLERGGGMLLKG